MTEEAAFVSYPVLVGELEAERDELRAENERLAQDNETLRTLQVAQGQRIDYEHAANEQLRLALTTLVELWESLGRRDGPVAGQDDWRQAWRAGRVVLGRDKDGQV